VPALYWALAAGALAVSPWAALADVWAGHATLDSFVVWTLRLPRALMALLVGALLALAGSTFQALFRNPLAEPALLGISAGGSLGAALMIVLGSASLGAVWVAWELWLLPAAAFVGSWLCTALVLGLARQRSAPSATAPLLLSGVAINALAGAGVGLLLMVASDTQARSLTFWTMGSFAHIQPPHVLLLLLAALRLLWLLLRQPRRLDLLLLGELEATHLGLQVPLYKRQLILAVTLALGTAVAFTGVVGFVGLVAPHLVRMAVGAAHRHLLLLAALWGGLLTLLADTLSRTLLLPAEIPIGILLALLGVPFFLYLIRQHAR
jgi:iron complex transport system permease protein